MYSFYQAGVVIERHDNCIRRITARDDGNIRIFNDLVDHGPETVSRIRKVDYSHFLLRKGMLYSRLYKSSVGRTFADSKRAGMGARDKSGSLRRLHKFWPLLDRRS